jgi:hypothetical protein
MKMPQTKNIFGVLCRFVSRGAATCEISFTLLSKYSKIYIKLTAGAWINGIVVADIGF